LYEQELVAERTHAQVFSSIYVTNYHQFP